MGFDNFGERFTAACMAPGTSSFADFLATSAPQLLPGAPGGPQAAGPGPARTCNTGCCRTGPRSSRSASTVAS